MWCLLEISHSFEIGTLYRYSYSTSVLLNEKGINSEKSSQRDVGYRITTEVLITPFWQNDLDPKEKLLKFQLEKQQLHIPLKDIFKPHSSTLDSTPSLPIYVLWNNGEIVEIYASKDDETNIKKGVASIFQLRTEDTEIVQTDISGECKVVYKVNGQTVQRRKFNCRHPHATQQYIHPNKVQTPTTIVHSKTVYELSNENSVVKNAAGKEYVQIDSSLWNGAALTARSIHELALQSEEKSPFSVKGKNVEEVIQKLSEETATELVKESIIATPQKLICRENCKSLPALVKEFKAQLKESQLASFKSASTFVKLLEKFRSATKQDLLKIMKNTKNKSILPQILDFVAAAQTSAAWEAALEYLDFTGKNIDLTERFLLSLSVALHPTQETISHLLKLTDKNIKDEKLKTSLIMALGSITRTYCKLDSSKCNSGVVSDVSDYLINNLNKCGGDRSCKLLFLRGLKAAALPSTIPILLKYVKEGKPYAFIGLSAIKNIDSEYLTETVVAVLKEVYYQNGKKYDSSTRILAAELLISSQYNTNIVENLILSFTKEKSPEISTYILSKMFDICERNEKLRSAVKRVLKDTKFGNYHALAQNGESAVFTKPLSVGTGVNITFGMDMEMISGGLLKQSAVHVDIQKEEDTLHLISIGLFGEGLGSIAGEESNSGDEEEETTAGMELTVLGIVIRPYFFFHGTGELMGHVWSGTGSDPISALQANLLLVDHTQIIALQNGFIINAKIQGGFSVDLSASISVSLWSRNSHSVVQSSGAFAIEGKLTVDSSFAESQIDFSLGGESYIDFITDFEFYSNPFRTCLQMNQPDLIIMHDVKKSQTIPKSEHKVQITSHRKYFIPGKSYPFHQKNSDTCSSLLSQ